MEFVAFILYLESGNMLLIIYPTTRRHTLEDGILNNHGQDIGSVAVNKEINLKLLVAKQFILSAPQRAFTVLQVI